MLLSVAAVSPGTIIFSPAMKYENIKIKLVIRYDAPAIRAVFLSLLILFPSQIFG
jgi:hypothetical protein